MAKTLIKVDKQTDLAASQYAEGVTAAIAAVQSDVDGNEADADAAIAAEAEAREAAITALQADVDANEAASDAAEAALSGRLDVIEGEEEGSITAAVAAEAARATAAEEANAAAIVAETERAEAAERANEANIASLLANSDEAMADSIKEVVDGHNAAMTVLKTIYAQKQPQDIQPDGDKTAFSFNKSLMAGSPVIYFNGVALEEGIDFSFITDEESGAATGFNWTRSEGEGADGEIEAPAAGERLMVYGIKFDLAGIATLVAPEG